MTVTISGEELSLEQLVLVARHGERVAIDPGVLPRMEAARGVVDRVVERETPVYGINTGVGPLQRIRVSLAEIEQFNKRLLYNHGVGQGPLASADIVRAAMLRLANGFVRGTVGVRPELPQRLVTALNDGVVPRIHMLGSIGESDLTAMAELASQIFRDVELAAGEGLALVSSNSFGTATAALALWDATKLLDAFDAAGAMALEAFAANLSIIHPAVAAARPYPGIVLVSGRLTELLRGSRLWTKGVPRNLQDPLSFRCIPQVHGAAHDALTFARSQLAIELNASQGNPIVVPDDDALISVANFDVLPLAAALDFVRIALAPVLTSSNERVLKMLGRVWSGLPTGLAEHDETSETGLTILGIVDQSLTAEARTLSYPVSFEVTSSSHGEGIQDRMTMAPLAARRLAQVVDLAELIAAIELVICAQALEVRASRPLGDGTGRLVRLVREWVPFMGQGDPAPSDLEGLREMVRSGELARITGPYIGATDTVPPQMPWVGGGGVAGTHPLASSPRGSG